MSDERMATMVECRKMEAEVDSAALWGQQMRDERDEARRWARKLQRENERLLAKVLKQQDELVGLYPRAEMRDEAMDNLRRNIDALSRRICGLESENAALRRQLTNVEHGLGGELANARDANETLYKLAKDAQTTARKLQRENDDLLNWLAGGE